jgi:hypothetical protein
MKLTQDRIIGLYGMKGSGKTILGNNIVEFLSKYVKVIIYNTDLEPIKKNTNIEVYNPYTTDATDMKQLNSWLKKVRAKNSNAVIYIRDLDAFFDKGTSLSKYAKEIKDISTRGRHTRNGFIYESKQPKYIPLKLISNTDLFFVSNFTESDDVLHLKSLANREELKAIPVSSHIFLMIDRWDNTKKYVRYNIQTKQLEIIYK